MSHSQLFLPLSSLAHERLGKLLQGGIGKDLAHFSGRINNESLDVSLNQSTTG